MENDKEKKKVYLMLIIIAIAMLVGRVAYGIGYAKGYDKTRSCCYEK